MKSKRLTKSTKKSQAGSCQARTTRADRDDDRDIDGDLDREPEIEPKNRRSKTTARPRRRPTTSSTSTSTKNSSARSTGHSRPEDAEAFASEYNRTAKPYGRFALAGKDDAKPKKALDVTLLPPSGREACGEFSRAGRDQGANGSILIVRCRRHSVRQIAHR